MNQDNTIIELDGYKLGIVVAPEVENDRGFIKFFRKEVYLRLSDEEIINTTKFHGNGIPLKMAKETIAENNYIAPFNEIGGILHP